MFITVKVEISDKKYPWNDDETSHSETVEIERAIISALDLSAITRYCSQIAISEHDRKKAAETQKDEE